jgi:hypothetical protein
MPIGTIVNWGDMWRAIWTALLAGLGFTTVSALALVGWVRASQAGDKEDRLSFGLYGLLALGATGRSLGGVALG